jgi:hypothetical protein
MDKKVKGSESDIDVDKLGFSSTTPSEVVLTVDLCKNSISVAEWACKAIESFTNDAVKKRNAEAMARLLDEGICECLVGCMHTHCADSPVVASLGCRALSDLSWTSRELREYLGELGACECVVFALNMHVGDAEVAENGSEAIINLCKENITNTFRFAEADVCEVIVQTGNFGFNFGHPKCKVIATNVCKVIYHMCQASNQSKLAESGSIDLIASLLRFHMDSYTVTAAATSALCGLASLTTDNRESLGRAGACALVVQATAAHETAMDVKEHCCEAIMHLALCANNSEKLAQAGACETVVHALEHHLLERDFGAEICCGAMMNLITYGAAAPSNIIRLRIAGAGPLMLRVNTGIRASQRAIENAEQIAQNITASETPKQTPSGGLVGVVVGDGRGPMPGVLLGPGSQQQSEQRMSPRSSFPAVGGKGEDARGVGTEGDNTTAATTSSISALKESGGRDVLLVAQYDDDADGLERTSSAGVDRDVYEI